MQFFSTRDTNRKVTSSEAIAQGLSDEGGLFVPESFPQVDVRRSLIPSPPKSCVSCGSASGPIPCS